jgi:hypothetical protein
MLMKLSIVPDSQNKALRQPKPHRKIRQEDLKVMNRTNRFGARRQQIYVSEARSSKALTVSHLLNIKLSPKT